MANKNIQTILSNLPHSPGVYQFFDKNGKILYVGKSVNLKSRINSYFQDDTKLNFAKKKMLRQIADIKIIVVNNETESLVLETNLIKTHKPKYNILMKDDKNHLYIKITSAKFPQIKKTRQKTKSGKYFGPYLSSAYVDQILKFIKQYFGYGVGEHHFFARKNSYNLDKYLFNRSAKTETYTPQSLYKSAEEIYHQKISQITNFLKQDFKKVIPELEIEMKDFARNLEFERAAEIKKSIDAIKSLEINQLARDSVAGNYHILHILEKYEKFFIAHIVLQEGKIIGMQNFEIENKLEETNKAVITQFIEHYIVVPHVEEGNTTKVKILTPEMKLNSTSQYSIEVPKIGAKKELLKLAYKNIYEYAYKKHISSLSTKGFSKKNMQNLLQILGYKQINTNIIFECNDISHISGNHTVASRSIIENGKTNTSKYKKYRIKTLAEQKIDDFESMREVMTRRLKEIENLGNIPDLIIIDGGKGQLGSVMDIISGNKDFFLKQRLQIVSLAKREEELFLPNSKEPIILEKNSPELRMIQKIRDEAHRFAITFNRDSRIKSMKKNILESLPGFGPVTRKKLLTNFGSVENLKNIEKKELQKYLNKNQIETLEEHGIIEE